MSNLNHPDPYPTKNIFLRKRAATGNLMVFNMADSDNVEAGLHEEHQKRRIQNLWFLRLPYQLGCSTGGNYGFFRIFFDKLYASVYCILCAKQQNSASSSITHINKIGYGPIKNVSLCITNQHICDLEAKFIQICSFLC